ALIRIGRRALKTSVLLGIAGAAFVGIYFFAVPFPVIVIAAALAGFQAARRSPALLGIETDAVAPAPAAPGRWRHAATATAIGLVVWWAPGAPIALAGGLVAAAGPDRARLGPGPRAGKHRGVLLQARGGELWRSLCAARLY